MKYRVSGANASTGKELAIDVDATTEREAMEEARRHGIFVSSIQPIGHAPGPKFAVGIATPMSGGKLFLIITGAVACGLTLALICYGLFFAATGASKSKNDLANPNLGAEEQAFITAIRSGDTDMVREYLVRSLNWREVATPALKEVMGGYKLEVRSYETNEDKRERQFWIDLSERLIKNGADVNAALHDTYDVGALRFLIAHKANVNAPNVVGDTALHRLANDTWDGSVALLLASGANVNAVGYNGDTPLHRAAKDGSVKVINRLLIAGAAINAKNKVGQSPLSIANLAMRRDAAVLLIARGGTE